MTRKKCTHCNDAVAVAKVDQEGGYVDWLCRACVAELASKISKAKKEGTLKKKDQASFSPLNDSKKKNEAIDEKEEMNDEDEEMELSEDEFDEAYEESEKYADVPVTALLTTIYRMVNFEEIEKQAENIAEAMEAQKIHKEGEMECVPLRTGACALRIQGQGVLLYGADGLTAKIHAPGRPSKLKVIALNVILDVLGFEYCTCPSDETDELLLLPFESNKRLTLTLSRDIEKDEISDLRKKIIEEREKKEKEEREDPELAERRRKAREAHLKSLEAKDVWPAGIHHDKQWDEEKPVFTKIVWFWAKKRAFQAYCHIAKSHTNDKNPILLCKTVDEVVDVVRKKLQSAVKKETNESNPDWAPKMAFLKERKHLIYILDNLFPAGNRSLRMKKSFSMNLFAMESHYQQLRGNNLGTLRKPPALSETPSEWDVKRLKKTEGPVKNLLPHTHHPIAKPSVKKTKEKEPKEVKKALKKSDAPKVDGQAIVSVPLIGKEKKVGFSTSTTVKQVIDAMGSWAKKKDAEKCAGVKFSLFCGKNKMESAQLIEQEAEKFGLDTSKIIQLTLNKE